MKRRQFLKKSSIVSVPFFLAGVPVSSFSRSRFTEMINGEDDKVLVLIQLNGGNDGLNTVIPIDQYDRLNELRNNIIIPENNIVNFSDSLGFHPSFEGMKNLYDETKLAIVQGIAYENQNRSHFRSTDIWQTGSDANEFLTSGWMGRYLDTQHPTYPDNYPNSENPDPVAITLGFQLSETCQGFGSNFSIALSSETSLQSIDNTGTNTYDVKCYADQVDFVKESIAQLNAYSEVVNAAFEIGQNKVEYPQSRFAEQMRLIAKLISGGLKTKVYVANLGGFDTHANQVSQTSTLEGEHADLLRELSEGILAFQADIDSQLLSEKVVGMTYSEFGRRIRSNGSFGSDHGTAAPMFVFGNCVNGGIIGSNADLDREINQNTGVEMQYDFRSVYASVLMDWFDAPEDQLRDILYEDFTYLPIVSACATTSVSPEVAEDQVVLYPNPVSEVLTIELDNQSTLNRVELYDNYGRQVIQQRIDGNSNRIQMGHLPPGSYFLKVFSESRGVTKQVLKI